MSELPLTVTRRRIGGNSSALTECSPEDTKKQQHPYSSPFSSFSTLSASLWSSAQVISYKTPIIKL